MRQPPRYLAPSRIFLRLNQIGHIIEHHHRTDPATVLGKQRRPSAQQFLPAIGA